MRVPDVVKMLIHRLADVDNPYLRTDLLRHDDGVGFGAGGGTEAGERAGDDIGSGKPHPLNGHSADHYGECGIHAAGNTDHTVIKMGVFHPLDQTGHLNVQHASAVCGQSIRRLREMRMQGIAAGEGSPGELLAPAEAEVI